MQLAPLMLEAIALLCSSTFWGSIVGLPDFGGCHCQHTRGKIGVPPDFQLLWGIWWGGPCRYGHVIQGQMPFPSQHQVCMSIPAN